MCNLEFPDLEQLYQTYRDDGFLILGIGTLDGGETEETVDAFVVQTGVTFPVVWDDGSYDDFGWPSAISPYPREALVDRNGIVSYMASEYEAQALETAVTVAISAE